MIGGPLRPCPDACDPSSDWPGGSAAALGGYSGLLCRTSAGTPGRVRLAMEKEIGGTELSEDFKGLSITFSL